MVVRANRPTISLSRPPSNDLARASGGKAGQRRPSLAQQFLCQPTNQPTEQPLARLERLGSARVDSARLANRLQIAVAERVTLKSFTCCFALALAGAVSLCLALALIRARAVALCLALALVRAPALSRSLCVSFALAHTFAFLSSALAVSLVPSSLAEGALLRFGCS